MILTPKQWQIARLVTCGLKNADIGKALGKTRYVIAKYLGEIYDKTGQDDRLNLALWYLVKRGTQCTMSTGGE